jgi:hypothetical protein
VEIFAPEKFGLTIFNPCCPRQRLALGTVPITAAVIEIVLVATAVALFDMAAESGSPTQLDRAHDAPLRC